ncbi:MAG: hypothetical protein M1838_004637 [Thelocarpon superellum]|nr:MAG: hypothetical protein M1838_004637 [Thelocarpon superellum]
MSARQRKPRSAAESIADAAREVEHTIEKALLVMWDDLPSWQQDNRYIRSGYRPASGSYWGSFTSLGYTHNETVNIYSHLIGAILFSITSVVLFDTLGSRYPTASKADVLAFGCFFLGAAICLGMSATYHTISNHSPDVSSLGNKLDYVGIVFLTVGSFIGSIFYGFYCEPQLQTLYWTMISTIGLGCAGISIIPRFRTPEWRPYRAGMFVAMGLSAVLPIIHGVFLYGVERMKQQIGLYWLALQGFLYILGAGIYAARVPERLYPGKFDYWGASHQIFHFLVVFAAGSQLVGLLRAFDYNHSPAAPKSSKRVAQIAGHLNYPRGLLAGQVAIVTGSGQGIGAETARLFAKEGAKVVVSDIDGDKARHVAQDIQDAGGSAIAVPGDMLNAAYLDELVKKSAEFGDGKIHIIVNNAGYTWDGVIHKITDKQWDTLLALHSTAPFKLVRAAAPYFRVKDDEPRSIINISSTSGLHGNAGQANYALAKAGVEWGPQFGVRSNTIAFGHIMTRLTAAKEEGAFAVGPDGEKIVLGVPRAQREANAKAGSGAFDDIPLRRAGTAMEAASAILAVASPLFSYVNGETISVTGGRNI